MFEQAKSIMLAARRGATELAGLGGLRARGGHSGRFLATSMVFPFIRTRSLCQKGHYASVAAAVRGMWGDSGLRSFYTGLSVELVRGVSYNAVMAIKEVTVAASRSLLLACGVR
eukprot:SAG22_NODE_1275_length_4921_cov_1.871215_2_plen_114_part_00